MPLTFPSHAAAVMPLKLWRPRGFDGVALVVGSTAPDMMFALGAPLPTYGHTWAGLVVWGVPLGFVMAVLIRRSAPVVAAHLPGWWRDYGVLGQVRHRWYVTVLSAWAGALTHRLWDEITHDRLPGTSLGFASLGDPLAAGMSWAVALHLVSSVVGAVGWAWATWRIGRRGLLRAWHGPPPPVARRPGLFWTAAAATAAVGVAVSALLPDGHIPIILGARLHYVVVCAGATAALAVRLSMPANGRYLDLRT